MSSQIFSFTDYFNKALKSFPYEKPNSQQFDIMRAIISLQKTNTLLIEASTGSGKTAASLVAMMTLKQPNQKIIVFVRTVSQIEPILREWNRIIGGYKGIKNGQYLKILPILGKSRLCKVYEALNKYSSFNRNTTEILCKTIDCELYPLSKKYKQTREKNSHYMLETIDRSLSGQSSPTIEKVKEVYKRFPTCGYYDQSRIAKESDIIIVTYPYMKTNLLQSLLKKMNINIQKTLILIDEAHNLVTTDNIEISIHDIKVGITFLGNVPLLLKLLELTKITTQIHYEKIGQDREWEALKKLITESDAETRKKLNLDISQLSRPEILNILRFIQARSNNKIHSSLEGLSVPSSHPSDQIIPLTEAALLILQSGTLQPINSYKKIFGLPFAQTLVTESELENRKFKAFVNYNGLTSKFTRRNLSLFQNLSEFIAEFYNYSPCNILVISPSYDFKDNLVKKFRELETNDNLIIEETRTETTDSLTSQIKFSTNKKIIFAISNGKFSEGVEIVRNNQSLISLVIFAGLPFAPINKETNRFYNQIKGSLINEKEAKDFININLLIRSINQAFGRTIRSDHDKGALIILDYRAEKLMKALKLQRFYNKDNLKFELQEFFKDYKRIS